MDLFQKITLDRQRDAEVINKPNLKRIWEQIVDKYSDQAHFLYELLQNADDALATEASFDLREDGLIFRHNGSVAFNLSDVEKEEEDTIAGKLGHINSITSAANTTKAESKIGKFGVGFKAVFQYTLTPHIYDDSFRFKIEQYIVPWELNSDHSERLPGETLFYFPFDHDKKSPENAYSEIAEKFKSLNYPVLFLYHLKIMRWKTLSETGIYSKEVLNAINENGIKSEYIKVTDSSNEKYPEETMWMFSKPVSAETGQSYHKIAVGFFIKKDGKLETGNEYDAFCFFKTKENTHLGFLIEAPFLLTDSRENIKAGEVWNKQLVKQLSVLTADSLMILKRVGIESGIPIIDDSILDILPTNPFVYSDEDNSDELSFKPFYDSIHNLFQKNEILPGLNGNFFSKEKAYWASDPDLIEIFSDEHVSQLFENPDSGWVFPGKGQKSVYQTNRSLAAYISGCVSDIIDAKKIIRRINGSFIESQTDEWLKKFYGYLVDRQYLWNDKDKLIQKRPVILNQNRKAVVPFDESGNTNTVFLPPGRKTSYDTVHSEFVKDEKSLEFFQCIGITKPDRKTELYLSYIPSYRSIDNKPDDDAIKLHFISFLEYYIDCPQSAKTTYLRDLNSLSFLVARTISDQNNYFLKKPGDIYFRSAELEEYFDGYDEVYFYDEDFYNEMLDEELRKSFYDFLFDIGVKKFPVLNIVYPELDIDVRTEFGLGGLRISHTRWDQQKLEDLHLEGLENALTRITQEKSRFLWKWLMNYFTENKTLSPETALRCTFHYIPKGGRRLVSHYTDSSVKKLFLNSKWLLDQNGNKQTPSEISIAKLSSYYDTESYESVKVQKFLGLYSPESGLNLSDEQRTAMNLGRKLLEQNISGEELEEIISLYKSRNIPTGSGSLSVEETGKVEDELDKVITNLKKGIRLKRENKHGKPSGSTEILPEESRTDDADDDELLKKSLDFQKEIEKIKKKVESDIEEITQKQKLTEELKYIQKYSFRWFTILLELEILGSYESKSSNRGITISFSRVTTINGHPGILNFSKPDRYIPPVIEESENVNVRFIFAGGSRTSKLEVVSVTDYMLTARLDTDNPASEAELNSLISAQININNPVFVLDELRKAYSRLEFDNSFNLQENLTDKIKFVFGPPGTGKTTYLVKNEIIPLMKSQEQLRVLVLTPTNKAADVLSRILIEESGEDFSYYDWFFRYGITGDIDIENSGILVTRNTENLRRPRITIVSTIARFAYDYITEGVGEQQIRLSDEQWDVIVFDEASMIPLAYILFPVYNCQNSRFIVAGDPFQIQPIVSAEEWKTENIYTLVNLDTFSDPETFPHQYQVIKLTKQFRSVPSIGELFSRFTYGGELEHHRTEDDSVSYDFNGLTLRDITIINFPVDNFHSMYKSNFLNGSSYHIYSALLTVEITEYILKFVSTSKSRINRIGIICPYRAQAEMIKKLIESKGFNSGNPEVTAGTIHGFQGDECDVILTVLNPRKSTDPSKIFLNNINIINVSISRARNNLILLMPDVEADGIDQLYLVERLRDLIEDMDEAKCIAYDAADIEKIISGRERFIEENTLTDLHQSVNVYSTASRKYQIKFTDNAVDIQIADEIPK